MFNSLVYQYADIESVVFYYCFEHHVHPVFIDAICWVHAGGGIQMVIGCWSISRHLGTALDRPPPEIAG